MNGIKAQLEQCRALLKGRGTVTIDPERPLSPAAKAAIHAHMENTKRLMDVVRKIQTTIDLQMAAVKDSIGREGNDMQAALRQHRRLVRHSWTNVAMGADLRHKSSDLLRMLRKRCGGWTENRRLLRKLRAESSTVLSLLQKHMATMEKLMARF
tara:strand:+ start:2003 stop:2464 length:462 start_codon:yes stop_codon:yes gene_type:complete